MVSEQYKEFLKKKARHQKILKAIRKERGIVYEADESGAVFWKNGELFASINFRFGSKHVDELFKGKKKLKKVM